MKFLFVAAAGVLLFVPLSAVAQFSVEPAIIRLETDATAAEANLRLRNEGTTPREFRVYLADFEQGETGSHDFLPSGTDPNSCAARLNVFPQRISLLPSEEQQIRVRLEQGMETCWSLVMVESVSTDASGIRFGEQIGVKTFGGSATAARDAMITEVAASLASDTLSVSIAMENQSSVPIQAGGVVEIRSMAGEHLADVGITPFTILPGRTRRLTVHAPLALAAGEYIAVPILDFDGEYLAAGQALVRVN